VSNYLKDRNSLACSIDVDSSAKVEFKRDYAPLTVQKVKNDHSREKEETSAKYTQSETTDSIK